MVAGAFYYPTQDKLFCPSPQSDSGIIKKINLDSSLLADIDKELQVPKEWIGQAKKNGKLRKRSTPARPGKLKALI